MQALFPTRHLHPHNTRTYTHTHTRVDNGRKTCYNKGGREGIRSWENNGKGKVEMEMKMVFEYDKMEEQCDKWYKIIKENIFLEENSNIPKNFEEVFKKEFSKMMKFMKGILNEIYEIKLSTVMFDFVHDQVELYFIFRSSNVSFRDDRGYTINLPCYKKGTITFIDKDGNETTEEDTEPYLVPFVEYTLYD